MPSETKRREVVVVTGASAGVGRAIVREFARHGAHLGLLARGEAGLRAAVDDVERLGGRAIAIPTDVADYHAVEAAAERVELDLGPIDVWVNDAMVTVFAPFLEMTPDEYRRVTEVTYLGYVHGTMAALRRMVPRNHGRIVQISSALAYRSIPLQSAYCGAKHAINGFTDSVRTELIHNRSAVRLTVLDLPAVNTPQFTWCLNKMPRKPQPVPPIYEPDVIARAAYWAAHHRKREMYVGGTSWLVIVGNKLFPGLGDWYMARSGYQSQMRDEPADPTQPDDLYNPVDADRDYGARGVFGTRSHERSYEAWVSEHRPAVLATGLGVALAGAVALATKLR
jgi:NAD(P)-dependent dehydrogenase (short-subunit alcohol dehydrogenase family)